MQSAFLNQAYLIVCQSTNHLSGGLRNREELAKILSDKPILTAQ